MARIDAVVTDRTEDSLIDAIMTTIEESKELTEAYDKLSDIEKDTLQERVSETVHEFLSNLSIVIKES